MSHPLDGAAIRIERSVKHFDELYKMFVTFRQSNIDKVSIKHDGGPAQNLSIFFDASLVVPLRFSIPVSDCIHNLRAALDYLVYELALLDSGAIQEMTQFPIEDSAEVFHKRRRNTYLRGLCADHVRRIELLQPYNGVQWTKTLRSISNPDKHCHLAVIRPQLSSCFFAHYRAEGGDFEFSVDGEKMSVKKEDILDVGFSDGQMRVIETLRSLITSVGDTIESFKPAFK